MVWFGFSGVAKTAACEMCCGGGAWERMHFDCQAGRGIGSLAHDEVRNLGSSPFSLFLTEKTTMSAFFFWFLSSRERQLLVCYKDLTRHA